MFWQKPFHEFVERVRGYGVPLRIILWNETEVDLGDSPRVTVRIPTVTALRHFLRPTLHTLGHAYVEGEVDVEGRVADVVDVAARLAACGSDNGEGIRRSKRMVRHSRKIDSESIAYHYDVSNEFYSLWLDPGMVYSCAYFRNEGDTLEAA